MKITSSLMGLGLLCNVALHGTTPVKVFIGNIECKRGADGNIIFPRSCSFDYDQKTTKITEVKRPGTVDSAIMQISSISIPICFGLAALTHHKNNDGLCYAFALGSVLSASLWWYGAKDTTNSVFTGSSLGIAASSVALAALGKATHNNDMFNSLNPK